MKKLLFVILFLPILLFSERYIIEYKSLPKNINNKCVLRTIEKYNMAIVNGNIDSIKTLFPDATIYKDEKVKATYIPNDTYFAYQWDMLENHYNLSIILDRGIYGNKSVIIGVLDTGIAYEKYLIPSSEADKVNSSDGYYYMYPDFENINFVDGYDYVSVDNHPNDMNSHGTSITSIIASAINNSNNLAGLVYNASIMPLRVLDENGEGYVSDIISAIDYAIENGCNVLNLSLAGSPGDSTNWHPLHIAIIDARNNNIAIVCATGNDGVDELSYPAGFEEAISVGAVDYFKEKTYYSQYGENLDFSAPGGVVYQDINNDGQYDGGVLSCAFGFDDNGTPNVDSFFLYYIEGTSIATPHITALIGLLFSLGINDIDDIENMLIENCVDLGDPGYDLEYGWGYPLPDSLFNLPFTVRLINYDFIKNSFSIIINPLDTLHSLDSVYIKSRTINEKISMHYNDIFYSANISGLNSGEYRIITYYSDNTSSDSLISTILLKSPLDTLSYIYTGKYKINFSSNNGLVKINNKSLKLINSDSPITISFETKNNPSSYEVIYNNKKLSTLEYSNNSISFVSQGNGYYYIRSVKNENNTLTIESPIYNKEIILQSSSLLWNFGEYKIIDNVGRIIENGNKNNIDFSSIPKGIYFIKGNNVLWKIIKLYQ